MKNPHAVALGRLGGTKGGIARAHLLSDKRRQQIAKTAGLARTRSLTALERSALAKRAAQARWMVRPTIQTAADAPEAVRRLLKSYALGNLEWVNPDHRYAVVRSILVRGDDQATRWLDTVLRRSEVRALVRRYRGAGCNEPERQKLREQLGLSFNDLPERPYLGFE